MPYGTVNLKYGVPKGETTITCTAGVGTFIVEFGALSKLTGDPIFEKVALRALKALWNAKSPIGLVQISVFFVVYSYMTHENFTLVQIEKNCRCVKCGSKMIFVFERG